MSLSSLLGKIGEERTARRERNDQVPKDSKKNEAISSSKMKTN